nr:type IV pilus modification protein PilV [uncultured Moraxella sp.]
MKHQKGIGLIEVMVSLLLLAVAVLGFSAMQFNAVKATDESIIRSRALNVMRGGAEMMRANPDGISTFRTVLNGSATTVGGITKDSCVSTIGTETGTAKECTIEQLATRDALTLKQFASDNDVQIIADTCPGTNGNQPLTCLIASWGKTKPNDCLDSSGSYNVGSTCFVMEAY